MKTAHRETHRPQELVICKLPRPAQLFSVLGYSGKDKYARTHGSVDNIKAFAEHSLLAKYTNSLRCKLDIPSTNHRLGLGRCCTPTSSWMLSDTMHFLKDMCVSCQQDHAKLQPKLPQDTCLPGERASVWTSTCVPQGGNVELNKLRAELHRGRAALAAGTQSTPAGFPLFWTWVNSGTTQWH